MKASMSPIHHHKVQETISSLDNGVRYVFAALKSVDL